MAIIIKEICLNLKINIHLKINIMLGMIKKVMIVNHDDKRERLYINGVPSKKETDIEQFRNTIRAYTNAKYIHLEYESHE